METKQQTIVLAGMPGIEWALENLKGHGGTEVEGNWYYTWEQAMAAAEELGDGWRLPTREEFVKLCDFGSTWDNERKGRWFGGNHATDHDGSIFLPASGCRDIATGALSSVGSGGWCWSSSPASAGGTGAGLLNFSFSGVSQFGSIVRAFGFMVRFVRDIA